MNETLILSRSDVERLASMPLALEAVEDAFLAMAEGRASMPSKVYLDVPEHGGDFRAMPAKLEGSAGVKWVNSHPDNPKRHGLPAVLGLYVLSDPNTALPLAILDGTSLTAKRTGAAAGVASKHLARGDSKRLGLIGAGVQAEHFLDAHRVLFPEIEVLVADIDHGRAEAFAERHNARATSTREAAGADIVCIATPSREPVVKSEWVSPGAHINAMGADAPGKQELEVAILKHAAIYVDEFEQAEHSGEINVGLKRGEIRADDIRGTLGEVIAGRISHDRSAHPFSVFDSTGLAVQDLALAQRVVTNAGRHAKAGQLGTRIDILELGAQGDG